MARYEPLDQDSGTLDPLPRNLVLWMRAVVTLGFASFLASISLLTLLAYRLVRWQLKAKKTNQFVILIFNLLLADIQQSLAFLLCIEWIRVESVVVTSPICFLQGWLVSTGDLASGVWCFLIGLHTFASVIFNYRLKPRPFFLTIVAAWAFIYLVSVIGVGMYSKSLYVRSGVWCWIHHDLKDLRLWTHYIFIFIFEFSNVIVYAIIYAMLLQRIRSGYYTAGEAKRVKAISNLMVVYPIVYVVCTLPLASARMAAMGGAPPSNERLCLAGAMITSNGWLDAILYTVTRRIMVFSDEPPQDDNGVDTFYAFWAKSEKRFGAACTVEAVPATRPPNHRTRTSRSLVTFRSNNNSLDGLCNAVNKDITLVTTTQVINEPAQPEDFEEMEAEARKNRPKTPVGRWSEDSAMKEFELAHIPDD